MSREIRQCNEIAEGRRPLSLLSYSHYIFNDFVVDLIGFCVGVAKQSFAAGCTVTGMPVPMPVPITAQL